jgi:hypothetical protein
VVTRRLWRGGVMRFMGGVLLLLDQIADAATVAVARQSVRRPSRVRRRSFP